MTERATLLAEKLTAVLGDSGRVLTSPATVARLSRDFYWYSPVLKRELETKVGDVVVQPVSVEEVRATLQLCYQLQVPVTVRGAGTGNYGQAIPLAGGVVLDLALMDRIEAITPEGVAVCQPGVRLGALENEARTQGWELRCYPSTVAKASVGGFLGGGSGGIGSVAHGGLRDFNTVRALEVVTMEPEPRVVRHEGEAVHEILHAWGSNGIITRIWLALVPAVEWAQCVVAFPSFAAAFDFSESIATDEHWQKRLVTTFEAPIASYFQPIRTYVAANESNIFFLIAHAQLDALRSAAEAVGGHVVYGAAYAGLRATPLLSDYTWNHTTLWAIKHDASWTYLQCGFDPATVREQFARLKARYGEDFLLHIEFMKSGSGVVIPGAIPLVRFTTEERLNEMIDFCRSIGVSVANPHVNNVEGGGRYRQDHVQFLAKRRYDPRNLLNPGKMISYQPEEGSVA
ncbi:MAG: FAD-binding oxidoreductase [Acidobacteriota bacterium]|nr:FAD-binding oxidoreductase [Acidobacteriota bacterium]